MPAPHPSNEAQRLAALQRYAILDTAPETAFDDFAILASMICETPMAAMTLVDSERQWFKAKVGLDASETRREHAFCAHTILQSDSLIVEDATRDNRFADNPLVTSAPHIRFYAGAPLIDREGMALGSLCVIDSTPRRISARQRTALEALARRVTDHMELRRSASELAQALNDLKTLRGLLPICAHCKSIRSDEGYWHRVENYISANTEAEFSHGICPPCIQTHFPGAYKQMQEAGMI